MVLNENMPSFNHRNVFVIQCSNTKEEADRELLRLTKHLITCILIFAITMIVFILALFCVPTEPIHIFILGCIITPWLGMLLLVFIFINKCMKNPVWKDVKEFMESEISEVALMNTEQVYQTTILLSHLLGELEMYDKFITMWTLVHTVAFTVAITLMLIPFFG